MRRVVSLALAQLLLTAASGRPFPPSPNRSCGLEAVLHDVISSVGDACAIYGHDLEACHQTEILKVRHRSAGVIFSRGGTLIGKRDLKRPLDHPKCSVYVMPVPDPAKPDLMWKLDETLWHIGSPKKVAIFVNEADRFSEEALRGIRIRNVNSTFVHVVVTADCKRNQSEQQSTQLLCLNMPESRPVDLFEECLQFTSTLAGKTLTVAYVHFAQFVLRTWPLTGSDISALELVSSSFGFDYVTAKMDYFDSPTLPKALVQEVAYGRADLGIGGAYETWSRNQLVTYLFPPDVEPLQFITPPARPKASFAAIFLPFDAASWSFLVVSVVLVVAVMDLIDVVMREWVAPSYYRNFAVVYCNLMNMSVELPPAWLSKHSVMPKVVVLVTALLGESILSYAFRSTLLSNLSVVEYERPLDTAEDILASDLTVALLAGSAHVPLLRDSDRPVLRSIYEKSISSKDGLFNDYTPDVMEKQIDGKVIFLSNPTDLYSQSGTYHVSQDSIIQVFTPFMVSKCFFDRERLDIFFIRMVSSGIIQKIVKSFAINRNPFDSSSRKFAEITTNEPISLRKIMVMFLILVGGLAIAAVVHTLEVTRHYLSSRRRGSKRAKLIVVKGAWY